MIIEPVDEVEIDLPKGLTLVSLRSSRPTNLTIL